MTTIEVVGHASFALGAVSYWVRDEIWLRSLLLLPFRKASNVCSACRTNRRCSLAAPSFPNAGIILVFARPGTGYLVNK